MRMSEMQKRLARAAGDLNAVAQELHHRSFESDWLSIEEAIDLTGRVCNGFLEEDVLEKLALSSDSERRAPGEAPGTGSALPIRALPTKRRRTRAA